MRKLKSNSCQEGYNCMQHYDPSESQFQTFQSQGEKLQSRRREYYPLSIIVAVLSLIYAIFLYRIGVTRELFLLLSFIYILVVNIAFFYLIKVGKRRIENKKKVLFFGVAFLSAMVLVFYAPMVHPERIIYLLGLWLLAILLNTVTYQYSVRK